MLLIWCVDIFAPGAPTQTVGTNNERINWPGSDGTSFASAYVAGLGAYLLGQGHMPYDLCGYIKRTATRNVITGLSNDTANLLAYTGNLPFKSRLRTRRDHGA
jgi:subtilisin family serine protease